MTIVTNRGPRCKRPKPAAQPVEVEITVPHVVQQTPKGQAWRAKPLADDPEAEARVAEFMERMIGPR